MLNKMLALAVCFIVGIVVLTNFLTNQENEYGGAAELIQQPSVTPKIAPQVLVKPAKGEIADSLEQCKAMESFDHARWSENSQGYIDAFATSTNHQDALSHALFATLDHTSNRLDLLLNYESQFSSSAIVKISMLTSCAHEADKRCTNDFIDSAVEHDSDNAGMWLAAASLHAKTGHDDKVRNALTEALAAPNFNEYYSAYISSYMDAFKGSDFERVGLNAIGGVEAAGNYGISYFYFLRWCRKGERSASDIETCISVAKQLESHGKTYISSATGLKLQEHFYKLNRNREGLRRMSDKRDQLMSDLMGESFEKVTIMMMLDQQLLRHWLEDVGAVGEVEAYRSIRKEAEALYLKNETKLCEMTYEVLGFKD